MDELGPWDPITPTGVATLLADAPFRWFLAGGWALALAHGRPWRDHDDLDVGICRPDAPRMHAWLVGWDLHVAAGGRLKAWDGRPLEEAGQENNVWCRRTPATPWRFDVLVGGGDATHWWSRRDPRIRLPWHEALRDVRLGSQHVPVLAPAVQLLMKSTSARPKDDADVAVVAPALTDTEAAWLSDRLPPDHAWQAFLR